MFTCRDADCDDTWCVIFGVLDKLSIRAAFQNIAHDLEDGWWRIPLPFVFLCPPQGEAFYKTYSCHHSNNLSNSCASLRWSHASAHTLLQKIFSLQTGKKKEMGTHLFKQAMIDSFFPIQTTPAELQTILIHLPDDVAQSARFKTRAFFFCSLASLWTLGAVGPLGMRCINVPKRLCNKHFRIFI